jgi:hypothetical protein
VSRPTITDSAHRHGITEDDMLHALRNPVAVHAQDDDMTMVIGPSRAGDPLEIGVVESDDGAVVIVHAMRARPKYLWWRGGS